MNNFEFYNPTKIIFGKDQLSHLAEEIPSKAKVLVLYGGGSIKKYGTYAKVMEALKDHDVAEFGGIPPNPEYEVLLEALAVIKEKNIDFLQKKRKELLINKKLEQQPAGLPPSSACPAACRTDP